MIQGTPLTEGVVLESLIGVVATAGFALAAFALKRAATVDVLISKMEENTAAHVEQHAQQHALNVRLQEVDGRLYGLHSDFAVLRAQVNGVNGNNGLNGTVKIDQQRIAHLATELEAIKMAIVRLELTLAQHVRTEEE